MLEPAYGEQADAALNKIENDRQRQPLWNAICDAVELVCDHPTSSEARREAIRLPSGAQIWQVPIRCNVEDEDWVLMWHQDGGDAVFDYIGPALR